MASWAPWNSARHIVNPTRTTKAKGLILVMPSSLQLVTCEKVQSDINEGIPPVF